MTQPMALAVAAAFASLLIRKTQPQLALVLTVTASAVLFGSLCTQLMQARQTLAALARAAGGFSDGLSAAFKLVGLALVGDFAARVCRELGSDVLAAQVELCGRLAICMTLLPVLGDLLGLIGTLLAGNG